MHEIVDWRPFDYVTWHIGTPMGTVARQTAEFTPLGGWRYAPVAAQREGGERKPAGASLGSVRDAAGGREEAGATQRASKAALERLVAEETKEGAQTAA